MKTCFKCGRRKRKTSFYKHPQMGDGYLGKCKECTKKDVSENYRKNIDHYVAYERKRFQSPERKEKLKEYQRKQRIRRPGAYAARYAVSNAIRDGRLIRQPCEICGDNGHAHHEDYRKPLDVRWLCFKHHQEHHGNQARI